MALRFAASRLLPAARLPAYRPSRALSAATPPKQTYTERQDKLGRPMSPHVTTYAFPIVAFSSVTVRITGMLLSVGVGGVSVASLAGVDISALAAAYSCFPLKFAVAFPLTYHYIGAVRHTLWDRKPESMLNNKDAEMSSYILVGSSTAVSTALALMPF
mmetsp:Transcript_25825/g.79436  ORF Transcript_25825/g.79436 Transcript_25825/m.79436 type:complete len:159 (-) Transcript_25825:63-539(-)